VKTNIDYSIEINKVRWWKWIRTFVSHSPTSTVTITIFIAFKQVHAYSKTSIDSQNQ